MVLYNKHFAIYFEIPFIPEMEYWRLGKNMYEMTEK